MNSTTAVPSTIAQIQGIVKQLEDFFRNLGEKNSFLNVFVI